jgi:hypothetical protein
MKQTKQWLMVAAVVALCGTMAGCKGDAQRPVNGTIDGPDGKGAPSEAVMDVFKQLSPTDERLETVMEDKDNGVAVWSLLNCSDEVSSEGFGMLVGKGDVMTALPQLRHGRMPRARYDTTLGDLWILGSDMEGTGVNVERPYLLRFGDDGHASIVASVDPYDMQEAWREVLTYSIDGQDITFYVDGKPLTTVTNHIEDMGGFMDDAIYIGEQISYSIEGPLTVHVTPGVNFVVGKVLHYDDMPTFSATVTVTDGMPILNEVRVEE